MLVLSPDPTRTAEERVLKVPADPRVAKYKRAMKLTHADLQRRIMTTAAGTLREGVTHSEYAQAMGEALMMDALYNLKN